jgi:outer membrane protein assembly factor BamB
MVLEISQKAGAFSAREVWRSNRLRGSNGPTLYRNGFLYGFAGAFLICLNADTQEVRWRERTGEGTLIAVGDDLVMLGQESGELLVAAISPDGFKARRRANVLEPGTRAVTGPSFADGRLYVRNLRQIVALRID